MTHSTGSAEEPPLALDLFARIKARSVSCNAVMVYFRHAKSRYRLASDSDLPGYKVNGEQQARSR